MAGIMVFRADGALSFGSGASLARIIGTIDIGSASGSIDVPQWADRRPWFFAAGGQARYYAASGTTLSWQAVPGGNLTLDRVYYGIW